MPGERKERWHALVVADDPDGAHDGRSSRNSSERLEIPRRRDFRAMRLVRSTSVADDTSLGRTADLHEPRVALRTCL